MRIPSQVDQSGETGRKLPRDAAAVSGKNGGGAAWRRQLLGLAAAACLVKLALWSVLILPRAPAWSARFADGARIDYDDKEYFATARLLAARGELLRPEAEPPYRQVYRTPGYPVILAALGTATGWQPALTVLLQALLLSALAPVAALLLRRLGRPPAAAWILVADPLTNLISLSFMTEIWLALCLLLALLAWLEGRQRPVWRAAALLLFALAVLIKPSVQYFLLVAFALTLLHCPNRRATLALAAAACLPLAAWAWRNHEVCGRYCLSTQLDACVMAPITLEALERGVPIRTVIGEWDRALGVQTMKVIMDNKLDFVDQTRAYLRAHRGAFVKYHVLGMGRVLFGTAREHVAQVFHGGAPLPGAGGRIYDAALVLYTLALYGATLFGFRPRLLRDPACQFAVLFVLYNVALIGIYAYTTGGGLKRAPFIPFIVLLLAAGLAARRPAAARP